MYDVICAYRNGKYFGNCLVNTKFRHVDYFVFPHFKYINYFLVGTHYIYIKTITHETLCDILDTGSYTTIDWIKIDDDFKTSFPDFKLYSCVTVGKKLMGINKFFIVSPFQLHKYLVNLEPESKLKLFKTFILER